MGQEKTTESENGNPSESQFSLANIRRQAEAERTQKEQASIAEQTYWRRQATLDRAIATDMRTLISPAQRYFFSDHTWLISGLVVALLAGGIASLIPSLRDSPWAVAVAIIAGGLSGLIGHTMMSRIPAVSGIPYSLLSEYGIKRFTVTTRSERYPERVYTTRSPYTLVGGWTGLTENGDDKSTVATFVNEDTTTLPPVRTDEIAPALVHTRTALDKMRAE